MEESSHSSHTPKGSLYTGRTSQTASKLLSAGSTMPEAMLSSYVRPHVERKANGSAAGTFHAWQRLSVKASCVSTKRRMAAM